MPIKQLGFRLFKPGYNSLGTVGGVFFLSSFFGGDRTVDLHLHDTYFVIATGYVLLMAGCYFLFLWIVYWLLRKRLLSTLLTNIHVWLTLGASTVLTVLSFDQSRSYIDYSTYQKQSLLIGLLTILFLLAQVLFLANIIIALFRKKKKEGIV